MNFGFRASDLAVFNEQKLTKKRSSDAIAPSSFPEVVATVDWILGKL
ncbi:MAG TPA: hypothetical protein ACFYEH_05325 [Candidatus Brocadiaceae bacterium]